jgi:hypothetical protein
MPSSTAASASVDETPEQIDEQIKLMGKIGHSGGG